MERAESNPPKVIHDMTCVPGDLLRLRISVTEHCRLLVIEVPVDLGDLNPDVIVTTGYGSRSK